MLDALPACSLQCEYVCLCVCVCWGGGGACTHQYFFSLHILKYRGYCRTPVLLSSMTAEMITECSYTPWAHIHIHSHLRTHAHTHTHTHTRTRAHTHTHTHTHSHNTLFQGNLNHICLCVQMLGGIVHTHIHTHTCTYAPLLYSLSHTYTHAHVHIYHISTHLAYIHIHSHTHAHIHSIVQTHTYLLLLPLVHQMETPVSSMKVAVHQKSLRLPYSLRATGVRSGRIPFLSGSSVGQDCSRCSVV